MANLMENILSNGACLVYWNMLNLIEHARPMEYHPLSNKSGFFKTARGYGLLLPEGLSNMLSRIEYV